ncbi:putative quinol monooxygenase [Bradyrhizobium sp. USDA 4473]
MIVVTGNITARPETFDEVRRLSLAHVHRSRTEPGCISHAVHVDCENPLRLVFFEQWADRGRAGGALRGARVTRFCPIAAISRGGRDHHRTL